MMKWICSTISTHRTIHEKRKIPTQGENQGPCLHLPPYVLLVHLWPLFVDSNLKYIKDNQDTEGGCVSPYSLLNSRTRSSSSCMNKPPIGRTKEKKQKSKYWIIVFCWEAFWRLGSFLPRCNSFYWLIKMFLFPSH